jgi:hypothetical protein
MRSGQEFRCSFVTSLKAVRGRRKGIERGVCTRERGLLQPRPMFVCVRVLVGCGPEFRDKYRPVVVRLAMF